MNIAELQKLFYDRYGLSDNTLHAYFSPGRVNLIGDHTDYNGGLVFPCAVNQGTLLLVRKSRDSSYRLASTNFDLVALLSPDQTSQPYGDHWINYPLGVFNEFAKLGKDTTGLECLYSGNLPNAAGLSSSASIEVVTAFAVNDLFGLNLDLIELIRIAQKAENDFVGVACGIMDQFAVAKAQQDHAMCLDCRTLDVEQVRCKPDDYTFLIANTNQRRELSDSHYNTRVEQTQEALRRLQAHMNLEALAHIDPSSLEQHRKLFDDDPVIYQRARHVSSENDRVKQAVQSLKNNDFLHFGKLMYASHDSLRDDYEVSSQPLDVLVDIARSNPAVIGSRLTGAGFGGCTVNLIASDQIDDFMESASTAYHQATGLTATFHVVHPSDGVHEVALT